MNKYLVLTALVVLKFQSVKGQVNNVDQLNQKNVNWFNSDYKVQRTLGTSVDKAYTDLIQKKQPKEVVVAIIDSGTDIEHEDFENNIWVNEKEIPNNNLDDDNNGYVDDVHGWNFLGNSSGSNVEYENYEFTRIVREGNEEAPYYSRAKKMHDEEFKKRQKDVTNLNILEENVKICKKIISQEVGIEVKNKEDLTKVNPSSEPVINAKKYLNQIYGSGITDETMEAWIERNNAYVNYYVNLDYDARKITGDNPLDMEDRNYGNPNVYGPHSNHGTAVAGVVASVRNNGKGIDGIASNVKIMALRAVPNGDERDKDIALAIRYAVDNGAKIINMSFGKSFSPQKQFVDDAIKYAEKNSVLLVHAAGNDGINIDKESRYPSKFYNDGTMAKNMINIGASDKVRNKKMVATFSNYGKENVDLFAPGVNIVSLDTNSMYGSNNGTSLSAPVVSGIAALVLSHYPDLTAEELIDILMVSSYKVTKPKKVLLPPSAENPKTKIKFKELSVSGGIVNAYNALLEAERRHSLNN